jgi:signal transduction histidine kinase
MRRRGLTLVIGLLGCLGGCAPRPTLADPAPLELSAGAGPWLLGDQAALAVDVAPGLGLAELEAGRHAFVIYDTPRPTFRRGEGTLWMALDVVVPEGPPAGPWVLAFGHPRPRGVVLHWVDADGTRRTKEAGLRLPSSAHDLPSRSVTLRLPLPERGPRRFWVKVDTFPLALNASLLTEARFHEEEQRSAVVQGLYFGGALALVAFNLVLFALLRRRGFLLFGGLGLAQALFFFARNGWLWHLGLWSATPRHSGGLLASLLVALLLAFTAEVLGTRETTPRLHRAVRVGIGLALGNALLAAVGLGRVADPLGLQLGLVSTLFVAGLALRQALAGVAGAGTYLVGHGAYLAGTLLFVAKSAGWVEHTPFTEHAMQGGSALNLVLSALALVGHVRALEQRHEAARQELALLEARRQQELAQARAEGLARTLGAQDAERERIARDVHDGLGHLLLELRARAAATPADPQGLAALADEALGQVRDVSRALYPADLGALGLSRALQAAAERSVAGTAVQLALAIDPIDALVPKAAWPSVLRAVQEALRNALVHGAPKTVSVEASREGEQVVIAIGDDGRGFDPATAPRGSGLRNLEDRAAFLQGTLTVDSEPGAGTRVELRLPVVATPG